MLRTIAFIFRDEVCTRLLNHAEILRAEPYMHQRFMKERNKQRKKSQCRIIAVISSLKSSARQIPNDVRKKPFHFL